MIALEWIKFLIGTAFLIGGILVFLIELFGVFKFKYVLNRMHSAAMGDTLGIGLSMVGLIIMSGINFTSLKLFLVIVFLWFASPVASHMLARFETATNEDLEKDCEIITPDFNKKIAEKPVKAEKIEEMSENHMEEKPMDKKSVDKNYSNKKSKNKRKKK